MMEPWERLDSTRQGDYAVFRVRKDRARSPQTGREHTFYVIEASDWVNIIPLTPDGKVVCVRQYRHGTGEVTLEVPGGMVDPGDASPAAAGRREMVEETGYDSDEIVPLGAVAPNPAVQTNRCHTFLALNARPKRTPAGAKAGQALEGAEEIDVVLIDPADAPALIAEGRITHALVVVAFYLFTQYAAAHPDALPGAAPPG